jgi:transcriptional regulator with XRE-family HTH domain
MTNVQEAAALLTVLRKKREWSKADLARNSGISTTSVTNYERGRRYDGKDFKPHAKNVFKLATAFGSVDGTKLLEAYGFTREAQEFEQNPPRSTTTNGSRVVSADAVEAGATYEVVGALNAEQGKYVLKDENGALKVAVFVEA